MSYWIGEENNTSGTYIQLFPGLSVRRGGPYNAIKLYKFESKYGVEYNITNESVLNKIDQLLKEDSADALNDFLYSTIINEFGAESFLKTIDDYIIKTKKREFELGARSVKSQFRKLLAI